MFLNGNVKNSDSKKVVRLVKREHTQEIRLFENGLMIENRIA